MSKLLSVTLPSLLLVATTCAGSPVAGPEDHALRLLVLDAGFADPRIVVAKSLPPQFTVVLTREMPTPGFTLAVDGVEVDAAAGRIVARISEIEPGGAVAQVITPTDCRLPLGALPSGRYVLELWTRRGASGEHRLAQALALAAS